MASVKKLRWMPNKKTEVHEWYERATLSIEKGDMAIRNMEVVVLTAFACSLATSVFKHMASILEVCAGGKPLAVIMDEVHM